MKFSYNWLQTFFDTPLPPPAAIEEKLTFHSSEVEEVTVVRDDTVFDVKVLPDKSAWLLSHRGLAKELSVILDLPLTNDPLVETAKDWQTLSNVRVQLDTPTCDFYGAAVITGVTVGPSPEWLQRYLESIGQRSINNIVDATNYVMFHLGQPLHAFDANTFVADTAGVKTIVVRQAITDEPLTTLSNESLTLMPTDAVITDGNSNTVLALAGVKGGLGSSVTSDTAAVILESAHFDRVATRHSARRHKLSTEAAKRYENGLSRSVAPIGLLMGATLIADIAGGRVDGYVTAGDASTVRPSVSVSVSDINRILGVTISTAEVMAIWQRFQYQVEMTGDTFVVTPPHERDDLTIMQDLVEEVGRIYGLSHIQSIAPRVEPIPELNIRHYYADRIRHALVALGFSEVYTSSFRSLDAVHLKNALATDKEYLRSRLMDNILDVRDRNLPHRDLLGIPAVKVFELGSVFTPAAEAFHIGLCVQTGNTYKEKIDGPLLTEAITAVEAALGLSLTPRHTTPGYVEYSLDEVMTAVAIPKAYDERREPVAMTYVPFSVYPAVSRDVALWVGETTSVAVVEAALRAAAGPLLVRLTHLDTFTKDGRTSLAFRLVFQSYEKTLDGSEVEACMHAVYDAVAKAGWEVR